MSVAADPVTIKFCYLDPVLSLNIQPRISVDVLEGGEPDPASLFSPFCDVDPFARALSMIEVETFRSDLTPVLYVQLSPLVTLILGYIAHTVLAHT
ncbi:hypothetical protein KIPB_008684 [Kipferlia bialata]|uniref:Uncharacterized protein n=1 Tax=Kipferlia bialata TaxID=797122 RepID=A0A9K3D0H0_9EUKA|nr:hypothetical protein KIPB_008684 [Kipferlia bialata]|eukprot:g8684.t1